MTDVINDCLGISQFITQHLGEEATAYLLAIQDITSKDWKAAKALLLGSTQTNRLTKEGHIKDIVSYFVNNDVPTRYLVANLSLCPGFQKSALELASYTAGTLYAVKHISNSITSARIAEDKSDFNRCALEKAPVINVDNQQNIAAAERTTATSTSTVNNSANSILPPAINKTYREALTTRNVKNTKSVYQKKNPTKLNTWTHGKSNIGGQNLTPQLKFKCIGIKSGPTETAESLKKLFDTSWIGLQELKIEPYSRTNYDTVFRVQFNMPTSLEANLTDSNVWPSRISVRAWKGNPKSTLMALTDRKQTKKLYIGGLSQSITKEKVTQNLNKIYAEEITNGIIEKIETYVNLKAWNRQQSLKTENAAHIVRRSFCAVLTSNPGQPLADVDLKLHRYSYQMQRFVRPWTGPIPWPDDHERSKSPLDLVW